MWWREVAALGMAAKDWGAANAPLVAASASIAADAEIDISKGPVFIGERTRICPGATIQGPAVIGADCLVGNAALIRGPVLIGDRTRIGFATEVKNAVLAEDVMIGPQCFVADSRIDSGAYLGAMVRTSNQRLDREPITVIDGEERCDTGMDKLGCWIGAGAALGIQVIVLPGRVVAPGAIFGPRVTIERNLPAGRYRARQNIELY